MMHHDLMALGAALDPGDTDNPRGDAPCLRLVAPTIAAAATAVVAARSLGVIFVSGRHL